VIILLFYLNKEKKTPRYSIPITTTAPATALLMTAPDGDEDGNASDKPLGSSFVLLSGPVLSVS
jgi:hypothetical protein